MKDAWIASDLPKIREALRTEGLVVPVGFEEALRSDFDPKQYYGVDIGSVRVFKSRDDRKAMVTYEVTIARDVEEEFGTFNGMIRRVAELIRTTGREDAMKKQLEELRGQLVWAFRDGKDFAAGILQETNDGWQIKSEFGLKRFATDEVAGTADDNIYLRQEGSVRP